jgi:hypothetical protein
MFSQRTQRRKKLDRIIGREKVSHRLKELFAE